MKTNFFVILISVLSLIDFQNTYAQGWKWAKGAGSIGGDFSYSVATDASGYVYVSGGFSHPSITFGTTTLYDTLGGNMFLVKYDSLGNVIWAKNFGSLGFNAAYSLATDASGNVYVTGWYNSISMTVGTITLTNNNTLGSSQDIFVAKFNASGEVIWAKSFGGMYDEFALSISADLFGHIYITGTFGSTTIQMGSTLLTNVSSAESYADIFVAKLDTSGTIIWAHSAGGSYFDVARSVAIDQTSQNVYVAGYFYSDTMSFGLTNLINTTADSTNMFLAKYDSSGNLLWVKSAGGTGNEFVGGMATGPSGSVYVSGSFTSPEFILGTTTLHNNGFGNIFLAKFDSLGNVVWAKQDSGVGYEEAVAVKTDAAENIYICGFFTSTTMSFGTTSIYTTGAQNMFLAKYNASGNILWAKTDSSYNQDQSYSLAVDASENIYVSIMSNSPIISFGATTLYNTTAGSWDIFLAKYNDGTAGTPNILNENHSISLFPNPTNGSLILKNINQDDISSIQIFDVLGRQIYSNQSTELKEKYFIIILPDVANGTYYLRAIGSINNEYIPFVIKK